LALFLEGARVAELAGLDSRVAYGLAGFLGGVLTSAHWTRRWAELDDESK
jgi:hypothetical protein